MIKVCICMICLFCILIAGCGNTETPQGAVLPAEETNAETVSEYLRYDGLYCYIYKSSEGKTNNTVLRFYEDGTLISAAIQETETGSYFPKGDWFRRESSRYADMLGTYTTDGDRIELTTAGENGTIDYWGTMETDRLVLDFHSNINGHSGTGRVFEFYTFDKVPNYQP